MVREVPGLPGTCAFPAGGHKDCAGKGGEGTFYLLHQDYGHTGVGLYLVIQGDEMLEAAKAGVAHADEDGEQQDQEGEECEWSLQTWDTGMSVSSRKSGVA